MAALAAVARDGLVLMGSTGDDFMPLTFQLEQRMAGFALASAQLGDQVPVQFRELIGPHAGIHLNDRLEGLQRAVFDGIPGLPKPSEIDHLLVVINKDLSGVAYVNELAIRAEVRSNRAIEAGEYVHVDDIADIRSLDLGVEVPDTAAVVVVQSFRWRRSVFYDLEPLAPRAGSRTVPLEAVLAQQALLLLGVTATEEGTHVGRTRLDYMREGVAELERLLADRCTEEAAYQRLLADHPWMLGGTYSSVDRHRRLDDTTIPDFTALRCWDACHDVVELKQPFMAIFRQSGGFTAGFNAAWNQAERYVDFADRNRSYLGAEKQMRFENARCLLIAGHDLSETELSDLRLKERGSRRIWILTYDYLLKLARHLIELMRTAGEPVPPGFGT